MKIAFVTTYDAQDINSWSGTPYYMSKAFMDAGVEIEFIGSLKNCPAHLTFRLKKLFYNRVFKKKVGNYNSYVEPRALKFLAEQVHQRMQRSGADIILSPGAWPIAYLKINKPIVLWTDATFANMVGYYPGLAEMTRSTKNNYNKYERNVLNLSHLSCFSSQWAANAAIEYYKADPRKIKVVTFGANLESTRTSDDIMKILKNKKRTICELLFIGQEWERKGADTAIKVADLLNKKGLKTVLHLVGITDIPLKKIPEFVINHGFLNKATNKGVEKINELFMQSHFFILPTRADCTPMVFAEANSFGLPVITFNTGGISSIITDEINGKVFNSELNIEEWADYITSLFLDVDQYNKLSLTAFNEYQIKLNWKVSIAKMVSYMKSILENNVLSTIPNGTEN